MNLKLIKIIQLDGKIILRSGLHIGSGNMEMHIGGTDNPVIKHPHTLEPYIPGSSLKGKLRSLMELASGLAAQASQQGGIVSYNTYRQLSDPKMKEECLDILKIFGFSGDEKDKSDKSNEELRAIGPTRVAFADCYLNREWLEKARSNLWPLTVEKAETAIDRISGTAKNGSLRQTELVPEGSVFDFRMTFRVFGEEEEKLFGKLRRALDLLAADAIGGNGSRGYGRIAFEFNGEPSVFNC